MSLNSNTVPSNDPSEDRAVLDESRTALYHILGSFYLKEVSPELLTELKHSDFFSKTADAGIEFPEVGTDNTELCQTLESEYTRLFIGPGQHVPPYGSVHRDDDERGGQLWGTKTGEVKRFMGFYGIEIKEPGQIPDHIGIMFEFMSIAIKSMINAKMKMDDESINKAWSIQSEFFLNYIDPWVDRFINKVKQFNPSQFYAAVLELTQFMLEQERAIFGIER